MQKRLKEEDGPLPLSSLRLFVPPLRLVSAALWQVVQRGDIMDYGLVEEFVTTVLEVVPDLMSYRERVQLIMGLRAQLVLELCRTDHLADPETIQPHLNRLRSCVITHRENEIPDPEVEASESNFLKLIQSLLEDPIEREHFFQNVYSEEFGLKYDSALQSLVWEFLSRLEKLLPTPTLQQTASWFLPDPSILEDCVQFVCHPEPLKTLLQYHNNTYEYVDTNAPSSVDYILSSLSLSPLKTVVIFPDQTDPEIKSEPTEEPLPYEHMNIQSPASSDNDSEMLPLLESDYVKSVEGVHSDGNLNVEILSLQIQGSEEVCIHKETTEGNLKHETADKESARERELDGAFHQPQTDSGLKIQKPHSIQQKVQDSSSLSTSCLLRQPTVLLHRLDITDMPLPVSSPTLSQTLRRKRLQIKKGGSQGQRAGWVISPESKRNANGQPPETEQDSVTSNDDVPKKRTAGRGLEEEKLHHHIKDFHSEECSGQNREPFDSMPQYSLAPDLSHVIGQSNRSKRVKMCSLCRKTFIGAKDLTAHMRSHTEQSPYQCTQCLQSFEHQEDLQKHQQIGCEVATQPEEDNVSTASFEEDNMSTTSFEDGNETSQPNGTSPLSPTTSNVRPTPREFSKARTCHVCQETFQSAYLMRKHLNSEHDQLPYQCCDCGEHFKRKFHLKEHKKLCLAASSTTSNIRPTPDQSSKARNCSLCNKTFDSPYLMTKHLKSKHDQLPYQCPGCGGNFQRNFHLKEHKKECLVAKSLLSCSLCDKTFIEASNLTKHVRSHTYQCTKCLQSFERQEDLQKHLQNVFEEPAQFEEDNTPMPSFEDGTQISQPHDTSNVLPTRKESSRARTCRLCHKTFDTIHFMKKHLISKHAQHPYQCLHCGENFRKKFNLKEHQKECHKPTPTQLSKARTCRVCHKTFVSVHLMRKHLKSKHDLLPYQCLGCGDHFYKNSHLLKHEKVCSAAKRLLTCCECGKTFKLSKLKGCNQVNQQQAPRGDHQETNTTLIVENGMEIPQSFSTTPQNPTISNALTIQGQSSKIANHYETCLLCNETFENGENLRKHMEFQHDVRTYVCLDCGETFQSKSELQKHFAIHLGSRKCPLCVKKTSQSTLQHVQRQQPDLRVSSEGVNPNQHQRDVDPADGSNSLAPRERETNILQPSTYLCDTCGKDFPSLCRLKRHLQVHTGEQPFPCTDCGKCFTCKGSLKIHQRLHTGERPFACTLCQQRFITNKHLKRHMFTHTREKPFQCSACGKTFKTKQGCSRHQQFRRCYLEKHTRASFLENPKDLQKHQQIGHEEAAQPEEDNMSTTSFEYKTSQAHGTSAQSPGTSNVRPTPRQSSKARTCHVCHEIFQSAYLMRKHLNSKHGQLPYQCLDCGEHFKRKFNLREHKARCHSTPSSKSRKCCLCNKTFNSPYLMRKHLKSQHDQLPYQCRDCGHFFKLKFNLKKHKKKCPTLKRH
ncbi:zinc finger protein 721-like isoform X1 [Salvelinus sp. IW2-2015]|uniref:zinc finger protein 721-like isoform X1 n=1 Tax=Salvelinus sp. IW2-2015 TaxID=2691554 RepID=UPI000CDFA9FE|nr:zinc finger protein Xfin-like [Salvelinus alpinus]